MCFSWKGEKATKKPSKVLMPCAWLALLPKEKKGLQKAIFSVVLSDYVAA